MHNNLVPQQKTSAPPPNTTLRTQNIALFKSLSAFVFWGISPIYFKLVTAITPLEVVFYRIIFAFPSVLLLLLFHKWIQHGLLRSIRALPYAITTRSKSIVLNIRSKLRLYSRLILSSLLILSNWSFFVLAIHTDRIIETSLGYFISPIITLFFSLVFLKEKLPRLKKIALLIACCAVLIKIMRYNAFPLIALILGTSFSTYALLNKRIQIRYPHQNPSNLFMLEMGLLLPVSFIGLYVMNGSITINPEYTLTLKATIIGLGIVTVSPLLLLNQSIGKLPLSRIGFIQYITPSLSFILATLIYREPFNYTDLLVFTLVWCSLFLIGFNDYQNAKIHKRLESSVKKTTQPLI